MLLNGLSAMLIGGEARKESVRTRNSRIAVQRIDLSITQSVENFDFVDSDLDLTHH